MKADLSHFLIGEGPRGDVSLVDALVLQRFADGGPTDGSECTVVAQIDLLHIHLAKADLSNFLIGEGALGNV